MKTIDVEALTLQLLARKTTKARFRIPLEDGMVKDILTAAYKAEVKYRQREFVGNAQTETNISTVARFLTGKTSKFGIMFCGTCGNGKTTMLYALQSMINYLRDAEVLKGDGNVLGIVDAKEVASHFKRPKDFQELKTRDMLAIEDMGREPTEVLEYGNSTSPVIDLLEHRYNQQLFTVITTNLVPKEIRQKYGVRIADRFNEMFECVIFGNDTFRK